MPRTARASIGGICYHVLNRGNARQDVFHEDDDHQRFIELIQEACARVPMRVLAWCLMSNHFHLVVWPHADGEGGAPFGSERWQKKTARRMGLEFTLRPRGRPRAEAKK